LTTHYIDETGGACQNVDVSVISMRDGRVFFTTLPEI